MADTAGESKAWLREAARASVHDQIADKALRLFDENGFEATTVDDLSTAIGISPRSFFRYFPAKEDVVISDPTPLGALVRDEAASRPPGEDAWSTLRSAFQPLITMNPEDVERGLRTMRVMMSTESLRARNLEKHLVWARMLEPVIAAKLDGPSATKTFRAQTLIHSALACFDVALAEWTTTKAAVGLSQLVDLAFETVSAKRESRDA
ncbi:TetR family transcriptional regulator [Humibacter antri]